MTEPDPDPEQLELMLAEAEAAVARFRSALPGPRVVSTTGALAAILGALPQDTPLLLAHHVLAHPAEPDTDPVYSVVAHLIPTSEPMDPDDDDSLHRMRPALGLTTVRSTHDPAQQFNRGTLEPRDPYTRARDRLTSTGDLAGGIADLATVLQHVAGLLDDGTQFLPSDAAPAGTMLAERSRLQHTAERLRALAPQAQAATGD